MMLNPNDWYSPFAIPVPVRDNDYNDSTKKRIHGTDTWHHVEEADASKWKIQCLVPVNQFR